MHTNGPALDKKRKARLAYSKDTSTPNHDKLRQNRAKSQKVLRKAYWEEIWNTVQTCDDCAWYSGCERKQVLGPTPPLIAPLKDKNGNTLTVKAEQMNRWIEHFSFLYESEVPFDESTLYVMDQLPELAELDLGPTLDEVEKAIKMLNKEKLQAATAFLLNSWNVTFHPLRMRSIHSWSPSGTPATFHRSRRSDHPVQKQRLQARL